MSKKPHFGNNVYSPCAYCQDYVRFESSQFGHDSDGCKIRRNKKGEYANIGYTPSLLGETNLSQTGCRDFISSGLPAHPTVLEEFVRINSALGSIPADENATEDLWDFYEKIKKYLSKDNIFRWNNPISVIPESEIIKSR